VEKILSWTYF